MNLCKRFSLVFMFVVIQLILSSAAQATEKSPTIVRYCIPQNDVYPFFITNNGQLTGINIDIMRQIFSQDVLQDATIQFEQRPWKRCNLDLELDNMDMMIGGFDTSREKVVYPTMLGFSAKESIVSTANVCFSSMMGRQIEKVRLGLAENKPFVVGIEPGFTKKHPDNISPQWLVLYNPIEKYRMLELGRVDAIVQVCAMDGDFPIETKAENAGFNKFVTLYPPYLSNPAYIVFSEKFARKHRELAKRIISLSLNIDKPSLYKAYQPKTDRTL